MQITPTHKPIEEATDRELTDFLLNVLQIDGAKVAKLKTREKLLAEITAAGWTQAHVLVMIEAERDVPAVAEGEGITPRPVAQQLDATKGNHHYKDDPTIEIEIGETPLPGGNEPAYFSVNGRNLVIPRNRVWAIPYRFYTTILDAHEVHTRQDPDTRELVHSKVTNYPISVYRRPSAEEVAAYEERVRDKVLGA